LNREKIAILLISLVIISGGCSSKERTEENIVTLRFMHFTSPELAPIYEKIVADFEKNHPNIRIREEIGVAQTQIQIQMAGNSAPDVIHLANKSLADFGTRDTLVDLRPYIERDNYDIDDFYSQAFEEGSVPSGAIYGMPTTGGPEVLYYNKGLFEEAGLSYPDEDWTWDDYLEAAKALTGDINQDGRIDQFGTTVVGGYWASALPWLWAAGGDLMNKDLSKCIVNSPEAQTAIQFQVDLWNKYKVTPKATYAATMGGGQDMFIMGKLGMFVYLPWNTLNQFAKCKGLRWDMALVPKGSKGRFPRYTGESFSIWIGSNHKEESWEFLKYLCGKEVSALFAEENWMPARKSIAKSTFIKEDTPYHEEVYLESMKYARSLSSIPYLGGQGGRMAGIWSTQIVLVRLGKQTVAEALKKIEKQVNAVLDEERAR
jgi:multiple sugar transport system substrate-binding protein